MNRNSTIGWRNARYLFIVASLAIAGKIIMFVRDNPQFLLFWDWPGHVARATHLSFTPWDDIWDNSFWGGYPIGRYPWGFHLLLKFLFMLFGSWHGSLVLVIVLFFLFAVGCWKFSAAIRANPDTPAERQRLAINPMLRAVAATGMFVAFLYAPGNLVGSMHGVLAGGGGPALLGTSFLLFFLASKAWKPRALWLGTLVLTHTISASVALLLLLLEAGDGLIKKNRRLVIDAGKTLAVSAFIGLSWILVVLDASMQTSPFTLGEPTNVFQVVASLGFILWGISNRRKTVVNLLSILTGILGLLGSIPPSLAAELQAHGLVGVHFFRYTWYGLILAPAVIAEATSPLWTRLTMRARMTITGLSLLTIVASPQPKPNVTVSFLTDQKLPPTARVMDVSSHAAFFQVPFAAEYQLSDKGSIGSTGLFYESAPHGLLFYQLKNALNPKSRKNGTNSLFFNTQSGTPRFRTDASALADLLGVSFVSFTSQEANEDADAVSFGRLSYKDDDPVYPAVSYRYRRISDTSVVEIPTDTPSFDPLVRLADWLRTSDLRHRIVAGEPPASTLLPDETQPNRQAIRELSVGKTDISFVVDAPLPIPLVVKFTYSPYWRATVNGEDVPFYWITPGHIFLFGNGEIRLAFSPPPLFTLTGYMGVATLAFLAATLLRQTDVAGQIVLRVRSAARGRSGIRLVHNRP